MKISVVIPVYNKEKYMDDLFQCLLSQTFEEFECILIDDGSTDDSPMICDEYAKKDDRIKVIHKKNGGLSDARNAGLEIASGDYIMFLDSDDYIENNMVESLLKVAIENQSDIVLCGFYADFVDVNEQLIFSRERKGIKEQCKSHSGRD